MPGVLDTNFCMIHLRFGTYARAKTFALAIPAHSSYRAPSPDRPAKRHAVAIFECDGPKSILFSYKDPQNAQDEDQVRRQEAFQLHRHG